MTLRIRPETPADIDAIRDLVGAAFAGEPHSDGDEPNLVTRLRGGVAYIPDLALVAEEAGTIVGHILFTRAHIDNGLSRRETLVLAPLAVAPARQRCGIGGRLVTAGHVRAAALGYASAVVVGHPGYYPRFGYRPAAAFGITCHLDLPPEVFMAVDLRPDGLAGTSGRLVFAPEFGLDAPA